MSLWLEVVLDWPGCVSWRCQLQRAIAEDVIGLTGGAGFAGGATAGACGGVGTGAFYGRGCGLACLVSGPKAAPHSSCAGWSFSSSALLRAVALFLVASVGLRAPRMVAAG